MSIFTFATEEHRSGTGNISVSLCEFMEATDEATDVATDIETGANGLAVISAGADTIEEAEATATEPETEIPAVVEGLAKPIEEAYASLRFPASERSYSFEEHRGVPRANIKSNATLAHENMTRDIAVGAKGLLERGKNLLAAGKAAFGHGLGTIKDCVSEVNSGANDHNKQGLLKLLATASKIISATEGEFNKAAKEVAALSPKLPNLGELTGRSKDHLQNDNSRTTGKDELRNASVKAELARKLLSLQQTVVSMAVRVTKKLVKSADDHSAQLKEYNDAFNAVVSHIKGANEAADVNEIIATLKQHTTALAGETGIRATIRDARSKIESSASGVKNWAANKFAKKPAETPASM